MELLKRIGTSCPFHPHCSRMVSGFTPLSIDGKVGIVGFANVGEHVKLGMSDGTFSTPMRHTLKTFIDSFSIFRC